MFKGSGATHEFDAEIPPPRMEIIEPLHESVAETLAAMPNGAGDTEYNWVRDNPEAARKVLTGDHFYFFPNVARSKGTKDIWGVRWVTPPGGFVTCYVRRNGKFAKGDRIVTTGRSL